jgi:endonuclease YncB( thermonuclease family)
MTPGFFGEQHHRTMPLLCMALTTGLLAIVTSLSGCGANQPGVKMEPKPYHALDGDTITTGAKGSRHIRLARIDSAELAGHPCPPERYMRPSCNDQQPDLAIREARAMQSLLDDADEMACVTSKIDRYNRRIAECWVYDYAKDGGSRGTNLSDAMLAHGMAVPYAGYRRPY